VVVAAFVFQYLSPVACTNVKNHASLFSLNVASSWLFRASPAAAKARSSDLVRHWFPRV
jgi:hypothetical protein